MNKTSQSVVNKHNILLHMSKLLFSAFSIFLRSKSLIYKYNFQAVDSAKFRTRKLLTPDLTQKEVSASHLFARKQNKERVPQSVINNFNRKLQNDYKLSLNCKCYSLYSSKIRTARKAGIHVIQQQTRLKVGKITALTNRWFSAVS